MANPNFQIRDKVLVIRKDKAKIVGTDFCRALVEYENGHREWVVYGALTKMKEADNG